MSDDPKIRAVPAPEIAPIGERVAEDCRAQLDVLLDSFGPNLRGYAIVVWDNRGSAGSATWFEHGPIGNSLLPHFVKDVLNNSVKIQPINQEDD